LFLSSRYTCSFCYPIKFYLIVFLLVVSSFAFTFALFSFQASFFCS